MTDAIDSTGLRIQEARKRAGLSQSALASLSGLSPSAIGMLESGKRKDMSGPHIFAVADALCVSARWLATGAQAKPEDGGVAIPAFDEDVLLLARHLSTVTPERREAVMVLLGIR